MRVTRTGSVSHQKNNDRRCMSRVYKVCWIVSRTLSVRSNTSMAVLGRVQGLGQLIGVPNSMSHLLGNGIMPSRAGHGNVGVTGA